jgi:uncharacterized protein (TIGR03066 family)
MDEKELPPKELAMRVIFGLGLALALAFGAAAEDKKDEKIDGKLLVGKWELVKPAFATGKATIEFRGDGKLLLAFSLDEINGTTDGTYKLEGNKMTQILTSGDGKEKRVVTVTKLTEDALEYEWKGTTFVLKRIKDKK